MFLEFWYFLFSTFLGLSFDVSAADIATELCKNGDDPFCDVMVNEQDASGGISLLQRSVAVPKSQSGQSVPQLDRLSAVSMMESGTTSTSNPYFQNISCIKDTGGTCALYSCDKWRGPTLCSDLGRCMCAPGFCAAAGGKCVPHTNERVAKNVRLISAKYPTYAMATPSSWIADILESWLGDVIEVSTSADKFAVFDFYELPNQGKKKPSYFLLSPAPDNNTVVAVDPVRGKYGGIDYANVEQNEIQGLITGQPASVQSLALNVFIGKYKGRQALVLQSVQYPRYTLNVNWWSSLVTTYCNWIPFKAKKKNVDPYLTEIWYPEPPLPFEELYTFSGAMGRNCFLKLLIPSLLLMQYLT